MGCDVDNANAGQSGQTDSSGGVGNEVEESSSSWEHGAVGSHTVHHGGHAMLTDAISEVTAGPFTNTKAWWLEVNGLLPAGVVGSSQVSGSADKLWDNIVDLLDHGLRKLAGCNGWVTWGVDRQAFLPSLWELTGQTTLEVGMLLGVFLCVFSKEVVPFLLFSGTLSRAAVVEVVDFLRNDKGLFRVEAKGLLELFGVISFEWVAVNAASTLKKGTETDGGSDLDHRRLVGDFLCLLDGGFDALQIMVTVLHVLNVPSVGLEARTYIFGESTLDITIWS